MKGGGHTSHDGFDRGQDDAHLLRDVAAVLEAAGDNATEEARGHSCVDADPEPSPTAVGTIVTRRGAFDASLAEDVWSDEEDEASPPATTSQAVVGGGGETSMTTTAVLGGGQRTEGDATLEQALAATARADISVYGEGGSPVDDDTASNSQLVATSSTTRPLILSWWPRRRRHSHPLHRQGEVRRWAARGVEEPPSTTARPTYASPDSLPLVRDPARAGDDAVEMARNRTKNTASNRLGGCDLRVLRDNLDEITGRPSSASGKRDNPDSSSNGATYASNKRVSAKKRLDQLRKEMDEATEKQSAAGADMLQMLMLMREDADRRAEMEDRRRREDREAVLAAEKRERGGEACSVARKLLRRRRAATKSSS
ncbi:hypothetical protein PR003_g22853 [Phytophthora rubi]|uniref:Uncharacterized protein n=1 Tax=Phytophthora rubi TaxID=129364 RepID=A0A6A4DC66_9STRA|nr:hypothetical protein PR003_g22853 [Phytophthora rubi]